MQYCVKRPIGRIGYDAIILSNYITLHYSNKSSEPRTVNINCERTTARGQSVIAAAVGAVARSLLTFTVQFLIL